MNFEMIVIYYIDWLVKRTNKKYYTGISLAYVLSSHHFISDVNVFVFQGQVFDSMKMLSFDSRGAIK